MPAPTLTEFKALFPEFVTVGITDPTMEAWINFSAGYLSEEAWGECFKSAVSFDAAHRLVISQARAAAITAGGIGAGVGSATSQIINAGADGLSVGFNAVQAETGSEEWYKSTGYGQEFLILRDNCLTGAAVTGSSPTLYFSGV